MTAAGHLDQGRAAFAQQEWATAHAAFAAADAQATLAPEDLEQLAIATYLAGEDAESADAWARAHHGFLGRGERERAARCAFRLGMAFLGRGEVAQGGGWIGRGQRVLDEGGAGDCAERGLLRLPVALQLVAQGDAAAAYDVFTEAAAIGERFGDADLVALGRLGRGTALVLLGRVPDGMALLDEVMVSVIAGEVPAITRGIVYCAVIALCQEVFDLRRAQEWTAALTAWCARQPQLITYRGQCLVHRAEIMALHGSWPEAAGLAEQACVRLSATGHPAAGAAFYQLAELYRLRGEVGAAETAYRQAGESGHGPHPGLALLRLAQGQRPAAGAAIRRVLDETAEPFARCRLLPAHVEIMLAVGEVPAAAVAAAELSALAAQLAAPVLGAHASLARGAVLLAQGEPRAALAALREACAGWQQFAAPYEVARTRMLIASACRELGDADGADLEHELAQRSFEQLGAAPALAALERLAADGAVKTAGGLTGREVQVIGLVATGRTNREIAADLTISEKTVARHISNIFTKLGVSSRSAATAYAYEHDLV